MVDNSILMRHNSLKLYLLWYLVFLITMLLHSADAWAKENAHSTYDLEPVIVYPSLLDEYCRNSLRQIQSLNNNDFTDNQSLAESLKYLPSLDVSRRGFFDVQADLQIRGGSFEQTDILIDGIKVNDPQTGHFSLDVPFFLDDMDKIILISGPQASLGGTGRQGGSLRLLTNTPRKQGIKAKSVFGGYAFQEQMVSFTCPFSEILSQTSFGFTSSGGYRYNTDFESLKISQISSLESGIGDVQLNFGFMDKEFGANGFYSEFFPEQKEYTKTIFSSLSLNSNFNNLQFNPALYIRKHKDRFLLDRTNPAFYENFHTTWVKGIKSDVIQETSTGRLFFGIDAASENIDSTSLGKHHRQRSTVYSAYSVEEMPWIFSVGGTGYFYQGFKETFKPDISAGYLLRKSTKIRIGLSQSFRVPTFTELYYQSPANIGNENLDPEKSDNYESGIDYTDSAFSFSCTFFRRKEKNLIDWVREPEQTIYQIRNIKKVTTDGVEAALKIFPESASWKEFSLGYTYTQRNEQDSQLISKYVFDYLSHRFIIRTGYLMPLKIMFGGETQYIQRNNRGGDFIINSKISKEIKFCTVFFKVDNLFNHGYAEKANIPMPGRWMFFGVKTEW